MEADSKTYEISFLARGEEAVGSVIQHLKQLGAELMNEQQIEKIDLAYPIQKHTSAHFGCLHFTLSPESIKPLEEALKFEEGLLRYLIVTPPFLKEEASAPRRPTRQAQQPVEKEPASQPGSDLSNEDLEAKLEEMSESLPES